MPCMGDDYDPNDTPERSLELLRQRRPGWIVIMFEATARSLRDIEAWCDQHLGVRDSVLVSDMLFGDFPGYVAFAFPTEKDAMLFRLRWGEKIVDDLSA